MKRCVKVNDWNLCERVFSAYVEIEGGEGGKRDFQGKQALLETILHEATFDEAFILKYT